MKSTSLGLAVISLGVCLVLPFLFFWETIESGTFRTLFLVASVGWFVFATMYSAQPDKTSEPDDF